MAGDDDFYDIEDIDIDHQTNFPNSGGILLLQSLVEYYSSIVRMVQMFRKGRAGRRWSGESGWEFMVVVGRDGGAETGRGLLDEDGLKSCWAGLVRLSRGQHRDHGLAKNGVRQWVRRKRVNDRYQAFHFS
ncbi:hypothetical protein ACFE04_022716 [Oxalis oulophora]